MYGAGCNHTWRHGLTPHEDPQAQRRTATFEGASGDERFMFTGHQWDGESGLYYAPERYYSPFQARWTTRDPLGMIDGPNVYAYVRGNPVNLTDPLGLRAEECEEDHPCAEEIEHMREICRDAQVEGGRCGALTMGCLACWKVAGWKPTGWIVCGTSCAIAVTCLVWSWPRANQRCREAIENALGCIEQHG